ncbi:MAG TPA: hypothetical protein VM869_24730, partial [Enhygromyxa sp.]|nr:hypothetical protein [Enhygromyxa sp.]
MAGHRARLLACILVSLGAVACASKLEPPTQSQPAIEVQEPTVRAPDPCAERSLDQAVRAARAALEAGARESTEQLGVAIEQALACEVEARRWQLELEAVDLLARLDPPPDPPDLRRCRVTSEGRCAYQEPKKRAP